MNDMTYAMTFAFIGWLASSYAIKRSRLSSRVQRAVIVPLWFVWLTFALGGPVFNGSMRWMDALGSAAACTVGMTSFLFMSSLRSRRSPR